MRIHKILILFSLIFILIGAASANENVTDSGVLEANETVEVVQNNDSQIAEDINVTFDEQMWEKNLSDISVDLPENAEGEFCLKINDEVIYNQTITEKSFKVPVKLPKSQMEFVISIWPPVDCKNYKVSGYYNGIDLNIDKTLKVMKFSPDYNLIGFPGEVLQHGKESGFRMAIMFPYSANGNVEIYLDGVLLNKSKVRGSYLDWNCSGIPDLNLGNHTLNVIYYNDTYYSSFNRTLSFEVVNVLISIPKTVNINHDSCISVDVLENVEGTVRVYLDGVLVKSAKTEKGNYILSLEDYLKWNTSEVKVEFISGQYNRTKQQSINIHYDFDVYGYLDFIYGEKNVIELYLPDNLNNKLLNVEIDGVKYRFTHPKYIMNNIQEVDISKLGAGNHTMFISYPGDDSFAAKNKTVNFTVYYAPVSPHNIVFNDGSEAYLKLPGDASGTLMLYVDGKLFKSVRISKGIAKIKLAGISEGKHNINVTYVGNDYAVRPHSSALRVDAKFGVTYRFTATENKYVSVQVSKNSRGYVIFTIDKKVHKVQVKNGIARYSLKNLRPGTHDIKVDYRGAKGFSDVHYCVVTVYKPKVKLVLAKLTHKKAYVKVKVLNHNNKAMKNVKVKIRITGKTFTVKTNGKGIAVLKKSLKLKAKKYAVAVSYGNVKISKTLKVRK